MAKKRASRKEKNKPANTEKKSTNPKAARLKQGGSEGAVFKAEDILLYVMVVVIALLLFLGPFYRGLFFQVELMFAKAAVFGMMILWGAFRLLKKDNRFLRSPLEVSIIVLLLAYTASFYVSIHKREALEEVLKVASYLVVYLAVFDICRRFEWPRFIRIPASRSENDTSIVAPGVALVLHLLLFSSLAVTIAGLGAAARSWEIVGAYDGTRISSPIGYANAAATYFMAAYLLAVGLALLAEKRYRFIYLAFAAVIMMTLILTFSRGAWLLLPPLCLLMVLASAPGERLRSFLYLAASTVVALPAAFVADQIFQSPVPSRGWIVVVAAALAAALLGLLINLYFSQSKKIRLAIAYGGSGAILIFLFVTFIMPALTPLHLERAADEEAGTQGFEQVVENVAAGETYRLSLDVYARYTPAPDHLPPDYIWRLLIRSGGEGYEYVDLFSYDGGVTSEWENKVFTFQTFEDTSRLDVRLYNRYPGTAVTFRSVKLSTADKEQNLGFAFSRILPNRFYHRVFSYHRDRNLDRRVELFRDALKVIRDYPLLGLGGGGWEAIYHQYKEQEYYSKEVHNHFLQVWVEAGIFGFLSFVGIWVSFAAAFIRNCARDRASPQKWHLWTTTFMPVAALGAHSMIDWSFSQAAVGFFLFVILGVGGSLDRVNWFERLGSRKKALDNDGGISIGIAALAIGVFLFVYTIVLINGLYTSARSQELLERNNLKQAEVEMRKAIRLDPLRAENYHNLSVILEERIRRIPNPQDIEEMVHLARRAHELEPYHLRYVSRYGVILLNYVDVEKGLSYIDRTMEYNRFGETSYVQPALSRLELIEYYNNMSDRRQVERLAAELREIKRLMNYYEIDTWAILFPLGRSSQLIGDEDAAEKYYEAVWSGDFYYEEAQRRLAEIRGESPDD